MTPEERDKKIRRLMSYCATGEGYEPLTEEERDALLKELEQT